jgi:Tol biopolymer transport system component
VDSAGVEGDDSSTAPSTSADGRYVAFESFATNLVGVGNDMNNRPDVFVHDRQTGITTRVSVDSFGAEGDNNSNFPSISSDGRYVAFQSDATNLVGVGNDTNPFSDIFVHDRQTGATTLVSVDSTGAQDPFPSVSSFPSVTSNGRFVAFESDADSLVVADNNGSVDVFVHDRQTGATTRVSVDSTGTEGDAGSRVPSISEDGQYVAFESDATNLVGVGNDTNVKSDIFVHDRDADGNGIYDEPGPVGVSTARVSVDSVGNQGNENSNSPSISADGRYVAFESDADNLVADDNNGSTDVFVHDRQTGATTRVSVDLAGVEDTGDSNNPSISADGSSVTFQSDADDLVAGDTNFAPDIFVDDLQAGAGEGGGGGSSSGGGGCFIATAADGSVVTGEK